MGLDISYKSDIALVTCDDADCDHQRIFVNPDFPGREAPLVEGCYTPEWSDWAGFRAGSYSGYNQWRDQLAQLGGAESANAVWHSGDTSIPFYELLNFSDCEGVIGAHVAAKLAADFTAYDLRASCARFLDEYFYPLYQKWHAAFLAAADNGAVIFH